jgi:hypothetical protein
MMEYAKRLSQIQMIVLSRSRFLSKLKEAYLPALATQQFVGPTLRAIGHKQRLWAAVSRHHHVQPLFDHCSVIPPFRRLDRPHSTLRVDQTRQIVTINILNADRLGHRSFGDRRLGVGKVSSGGTGRNISRTPRTGDSTEERLANVRYPASATQPHAEETFRIIRIAVDTGDVKTVSYTPSEILTRTNLLPRDLVSLALSSRRLQRRCRTGGKNTLVATMRGPPAILPRRDCILLSFGPIRAVAERDFVYIFDIHNEVARSFAMEVSQVFQYRAAAIERDNQLQPQQQSQPHSNDKDGNATMGDDTRSTTTPFGYPKTVAHSHEDPPELVFLETVLADAVDSFSRRIRIFKPIVDDLLLRVSTDEEFSGSGIHQLAPLKEKLQSFEVYVTQAYQCLTQLLNDDEEMLKLLLTEQAGRWLHLCVGLTAEMACCPRFSPVQSPLTS